MIRRIALTLIPCVAVFAAAACLCTTRAANAGAKSAHTTRGAAQLQVAKRSGYIVASS